MKPFLEYLGTILHILGIVLFAGGHIWFGFFAALAERRRDREGVRFLASALPLMANVFGLGVLILFCSGLLKLVIWGEPGLIFLPDPYGWVLFSKLLLYIIIVCNGILIERRYVPYVLQEIVTTPGRSTTAAWRQMTMRVRLNLLLILVVVALGEAMRHAKF